jgi:basic amino acid/polyamine antiporter, APA family
MPWAMARGGVFPSWLGVTGRSGTPVRAHLVSSALLTVVTLMNFAGSLGELFEELATISIASGLAAYLVTVIAAAKLLRREPLVLAAVPVSAAFMLWMLYGLGPRAVLLGLLLLVAGLPIYWSVRRGQANA